jgi:hypothetical protein
MKQHFMFEADPAEFLHHEQYHGNSKQKMFGADFAEFPHHEAVVR